jgi:Tol biopolymer transport system component
MNKSQRLPMFRITRRVELYYTRVLFYIFTVFLITILTSACSKDKPLDLGSFKHIDGLSISPDGNSILFSGRGHKDYPRITTYRYDRNTGKLYRYIPRDEREQIIGGRYAPESTHILLTMVPLDNEKNQLIEDMQIATINQDGTGFRQITTGKGVKVGQTISYDEKTLVYSKGKQRKSGKTQASDFDLYKIDLMTGKETQLTNLSFYGESDPYFTPDGKSVVFSGESPLKLPRGGDARQFRDTYKQKYGENIILQYPLDGSGIDKWPVPVINFGTGSRWPMVTKDGSIWFLGITGEEHYIGYYRRFPDGRTVKLPDNFNGGQEKYRFQITITSDGRLLLILFESRGKSKERSIGIFDTVTGTLSELTIPATAENIQIQ